MLGGVLHMNQYQTGKLLEKLGAISGKDMTTESAITKLMFMLGLKCQKTCLKQFLKQLFVEKYPKIRP